MDDSDRLSALEQALCARLGHERYDLWIGSRTELALSGETVVVRCASAAEMRFLKRRVESVLADVVAQVYDGSRAIRYEAGDSHDLLGPTPASASLAPSRTQPPQPARSAQRRKLIRPTHTQRTFGPDFDEPAPEPAAGASAPVAAAKSANHFEDFHVGRSNALAVQACREAAEQSGRYSPLLVTGPVGCGKSRLFAALIRRARAVRPRLRVLSLSAEQFTTQFVDALHRRDLPGFRHKTRSADLLVIDDVQFLASKKATLAELVYTIDAVQSHGGQVALAADRPAAELHASGPELAARLAAGLTTAMELPEYEVRRGIVATLAAAMGMELPPAVVDRVARQVVGSGRLLSGALNRLAAASAAADSSITADFAERELEEFCRQHSPQVRLADIQRAVCEAFGVEQQALKSARKDRGVAEPRMLAMWLARRYTRAALSEIGEFFGRRSHSTVVSAQKKVDRLIGDSGELRVGDGSCHVEEAVRRVEARLRMG